MKTDNIIGNTEVKKYLSNSIDSDNILHSYLFLGNDGIGKYMLAKTFARSVLCLNGGKDDNCTCKSCKCFDGDNHPDFHVIEEKEKATIPVDKIREGLIYDASIKPIISNRKVYIVRDAEKMNASGQNALLKTLEEPPEYVVIILITSNENMILTTIRSRCMTIKFQKIDDKNLLKYAKEVVGYSEVSETLLKSFDGSISNVIKFKQNEENYAKIDEFISSLDKKDLVDIMLDSKNIFSKDTAVETLEYMLVSLYSNREKNNKYLKCIEYTNDAINRLKANNMYAITIDNLLLNIWEELNESSNRC